MNNSDLGQINRNAAEIYEEFFVPALFQDWASRLTDAANLKTNHRVLDVACGTGVLAREIAKRVRTAEQVVGLDINAGMLAVAQRQAPEITWRQGKAEAIPFDDETFDAVLSQFGLMFFEDRAAAIREMARVLKSGGRMVIAVWDALENTPGYAAMVELLHRLFGKEIANGLRAPYSLGDRDQLHNLFDAPELTELEILTQEGHARFPSIEAWVHTDVKGWTLADQIDDQQYAQLLQEAKSALAHFVTDDGRIVFRAPAHLICAHKRDS